ncbi:phosphoribosylamine--glycine ligase [Gemella sp. zg-1178]|uniref:phosphoribosylamine--glycine ligase n=1 Tax=Gemella sp. zg-1178 TaxID=2840372 RepID=UPI001C04F9C5|nr:phosphoribosylamine--glycine ligase [Gemella sp. zg-1178]MBU0278171.1 phosphoribosylamine--glycine ligase [Gemella sp. zg-1178]
MKVLVIGRGGREHALCRKIKKSKKVAKVFVAPGNDGMRNDATLVNIAELDFEKLKDFVKKEKIDWLIVGPEEPLVKGIYDELSPLVKVFGPDKYTAQMEGSKSFAKEVMTRFNVPTAAYEEFTNLSSALDYAKNSKYPLVIKKDGLAAGKGVVIANNFGEAEECLKNFYGEDIFCKIVIEEFLEGEEFSLMAFVNGEIVIPFDEIAQDHKRAYDFDKGANTGGMGAYSPVPQISKKDRKQAIDEVLLPVCRGLASEGTSYHGFLYAGLIASQDGVKVIEFNARLGDPEAQVLLEKMDSDIMEVIEKIYNNEEVKLKWSDDAVCGVVLAAEGYPASYLKGIELENFTLKDTCYVAALEEKNGIWFSNGGRVLLVYGRGKDIKEAKANAYKAIDNLSLSPKLFFRKDIGDKAIK